MATTILSSLQKCADDCPHAVHGRLLRWTKPATRTPVHGAMANIAMSKAALVAENALLRQQLIVLQRQVTQPPAHPASVWRWRPWHAWRMAGEPRCSSSNRTPCCGGIATGPVLATYLIRGSDEVSSQHTHGFSVWQPE